MHTTSVKDLLLGKHAPPSVFPFMTTLNAFDVTFCVSLMTNLNTFDVTFCVSLYDHSKCL